MKTVWPTLAKKMMRSDDGQVTVFEETKVLNRPAIYMEITGKTKMLSGATEEKLALMTVSMDIERSAVVTGFCFSDAVNFDDKHKAMMRKLSAAAISSRMYLK